MLENMENVLIGLAVVIAVGVFAAVLGWIKREKKEEMILKINQELQTRILSGDFIPYEEFEQNWISIRRGNRGVAGYKYFESPGCYVITMYSYPVQNGNYTNYENIYIGQSTNVCQRVHNHFHGKGNGDVYADIKYGKYAYVQILPCRAEEMNALEIQLIQAFDATKSYNRTKGGGTYRGI